MKKHLTQMSIAGAVVLSALVLFGVPLATAARYALLLACPVMMLRMMRSMSHGADTGHATPRHEHGEAHPVSPARPGDGRRDVDRATTTGMTVRAALAALGKM